jgi:hypothetical protein
MRPNTAYIERLNLFLRRSCSYMHRRTSGKVRNPERLASAVEILRCAYNNIRSHARLCLGREARTPAMQARIFDRVLSWREVFGWPLRPLCLPKTPSALRPTPIPPPEPASGPLYGVFRMHKRATGFMRSRTGSRLRLPCRVPCDAR